MDGLQIAARVDGPAVRDHHQLQNQAEQEFNWGFLGDNLASTDRLADGGCAAGAERSF